MTNSAFPQKGSITYFKGHPSLSNSIPRGRGTSTLLRPGICMLIPAWIPVVHSSSFLPYHVRWWNLRWLVLLPAWEPLNNVYSDFGISTFKHVLIFFLGRTILRSSSVTNLEIKQNFKNFCTLCTYVCLRYFFSHFLLFF